MSETGAEVSEEVSRISRRIGVHTLEAFDAGTDPYLDAVLRDRANAGRAALDAFTSRRPVRLLGVRAALQA